MLLSCMMESAGSDALSGSQAALKVNVSPIVGQKTGLNKIVSGAVFNWGAAFNGQMPKEHGVPEKDSADLWQRPGTDEPKNYPRESFSNAATQGGDYLAS